MRGDDLGVRETKVSSIDLKRWTTRCGQCEALVPVLLNLGILLPMCRDFGCFLS